MINHRVEAHIDLTALKHNFQIVKSLAPQQSIMAMIKANAYGHGLLQVAHALSDANAFGVARLEEALQLRAANISQPIVIMSGILSAEELQIAAAQQFELVIHEASQLEILKHTKIEKPIKVWLKIDTGMHRLGFPLDKIHEVYQQLRQNHNVQSVIYLMTHLASADDVLLNSTKIQIDNFYQVTKDLAGPKSIANSAGIIAWPQSHADWVRPGIMLYGASPMSKDAHSNLNLKPVMTLQAKIIAINFLRKGDAVGYGGNWVCPEDMNVAVVAIGYGDGYPRQLKNGTPILIHNLRCPLIGRVSMDMISVDIRSCPIAKVGDVVTLWGKNLPAEEIASHADTISYTLFCGVTERVQFIYEGVEKK